MCRSLRRTRLRTTAPPTLLEVMMPSFGPLEVWAGESGEAGASCKKTPRNSHLPVTEEPFSRTLRKSLESFSRWTLRGFGSMRSVQRLNNSLKMCWLNCVYAVLWAAARAALITVRSAARRCLRWTRALAALLLRSVWRSKCSSTPFGSRRLRPCWRRRERMARPFLVFIRARKPNCCLRVRLEGW